MNTIELAREISRHQKPSDKWQKIIKTSARMPDGAEIWENELYEITVRRLEPNLIQIGINSIDGSARHDWRDFQNIKNDVCGSEWEAVELYPAESRLIDPSNYYMLWCRPFIKLGIYKGRSVIDADKAIAPQRPFPK